MRNLEFSGIFLEKAENFYGILLKFGEFFLNSFIDIFALIL